MAQINFDGGGDSNFTLPSWSVGGGDYTPPDPPPYITPPTSAPSPTSAPPSVTTQPLPRAASPSGNWSSTGFYPTPTGAPPPAGPVAPPTPTVNSSNPMDDAYILSRIKAWSQVAGSNPSLANDPNYWLGRIKQTGGLTASNDGYWQNLGMRPEGAPESWSASNPGGTATGATPYLASGTNPGGYDDPSAMIYLNQLLQRLNQVQQPVDNSILDQLKALVQANVSRLNQAPYTDTESQALITQMRDPITQARDQAKQQAAENMSRRGISPTSGIFQAEMTKIDNAYQTGVAQGSNQLAVNAVAQKNTNAAQALSELNSLLGVQNTSVDRANAMADQAVTLAQGFPNFDASRLNSLLAASGDTSSASSALSSLVSLGNVNNVANSQQNATDQANAAAWGKLIAAILASIGH